MHSPYHQDHLQRIQGLLLNSSFGGKRVPSVPYVHALQGQANWSLTPQRRAAQECRSATRPGVRRPHGTHEDPQNRRQSIRLHTGQRLHRHGMDSTPEGKIRGSQTIQEVADQGQRRLTGAVQREEILQQQLLRIHELIIQQSVP